MSLEIKEVTKRFGGLIAVNNVTFTVEERKINALIGPNGAGKTTTFNCISGFYKPDSGKINYKGREIQGMPPYEIIKLGIARTFQLVRSFDSMSVLENVMTAGHFKSGQHIFNTMFRLPSITKSEQQLRNKALEILDMLKITEIAHKYPNELSYGQKRLVEIAKVLATDASHLLLDEPAAGLNDQETEGLMEIIKEIQKLGKTILIVEHNMKFVMGLADKVVVLNFGQKIADGSPDEVKSNQTVIKAYLGKEYSNA